VKYLKHSRRNGARRGEAKSKELENIHVSTGAIQAVVEKFSEDLTLFKISDLQGWSAHHTSLARIGDWARSRNCARTAAACEAASDLAEKVILHEETDPPKILDVYTALVSVLREVVVDTEADGSVVFPAPLPGAAPDSEPAAPEENAGAIQTVVEQLAEDVMLFKISDLQGWAAHHGNLVRVGDWARSQDCGRSAAACDAAADLVEKVILHEDADPAKTVDVLSGLITALQAVVSDPSADASVAFPADFAGSASETAEASSTPFSLSLPPHVDESIFADFLGRQDSSLDEMETLIITLEETMEEQKLAELKRMMHTLKGDSALLGLTEVETLCHRAEDGLAATPPIFASDLLLELRDWLKRAFDFYAGKGEPPEAAEGLVARFVQAAAGEKAPSVASSAPSMASPAPSVASPAPSVAPLAPSEAPPAPSEASSEEDDGLVFVPKMLEGDIELLGDFVQEANEHLDNSDVHLLTLETDPVDDDALNSVFRAFHTIKGVAGFLALDEIGSLAHDSENLLDSARKGDRVLEGAALDLVFDAVDTMKLCLENLSRALSMGSEMETVEGLPELVRRIRRLMKGEVDPLAAEEDGGALAPNARLGDALVDSGTVTREAVDFAIKEQEQPMEAKRLGEVLVDTSVTNTKAVTQALEIQQGAGDKKLGEVLIDMGEAEKEDIDRAVTLQSKQAGETPKLGELLVRSGEASSRDVAKILREQKQTKDALQTPGKKQVAVQVREAVKVDADRLDLLVDSIGELVIAESMVAQSPDLQDSLTPELGRHLNQLDKITRELQMMAMSLRMVPVRSTFQKMARLVRDLSKKTDKPVEFSMQGEETELDKTVVDRIGDPLVHIIRNAVDHGLEASPEDRTQAGKQPAGKIKLRAFHAGGNIHIEVSDDGRGLDRDRILQKAIDRGLVQEGAEISDREVWNLIFEAGFSTAAQVTEVSGRGVGMDVVRRNIESLRGKTEIVSERGKGSTFTIQLPLTLAIIDGMVVRVGEERFVLPTLTIVFSVRPKDNEVSTVVGKGELLSLQGELLPLHRVYETFSIADAKKEVSGGTVVVVEHDGRRCGLLVDEILGQQQIVIKSLGEALKGLPGLAGGAIMPDGRVGLILDVGGLVKLAENG
jgi:two-component system, chemotaxis family, sensor kinase CheA